MSAGLTLKVPGLRETGERARWLSDPKTMSYNIGTAEGADGYDCATGCIEFPVSDWRWWRGAWLNREPDRYAAFILRPDGRFVGEVCYWFDMETDMHSAGVLVMHRYRRRGYGTEALRLLLEHAEAREDIDTMFIELPVTREDAVRMYLTNGFCETRTENGIIRLEKRILRSRDRI